MVKEISGMVSCNPMEIDNCTAFIIRDNEGMYLVLSKGIQGIKDNIFVKEGQEIKIRGDTINDEWIKGIILAEKSEINMMNIINKT